jgi:hypothetical protein
MAAISRNSSHAIKPSTSTSTTTTTTTINHHHQPPPLPTHIKQLKHAHHLLIWHQDP